METEVGDAIGKKRPVLSVPPSVGYAVVKMIGLLVGDVVTTWDEIQGLMAGLVDDPFRTGGIWRMIFLFHNRSRPNVQK
jgi:hypothetical protein